MTVNEMLSKLPKGWMLVEGAKSTAILERTTLNELANICMINTGVRRYESIMMAHSFVHSLAR